MTAHFLTDVPATWELGDERVVFTVRGDLDHSGSYAPGYLCLTEQRVLVGNDTEIELSLTLADVERFSSEELRGRNRLTARLTAGDAERVLLPYTRYLTNEFSAVVRALEAARKGEAPLLPERIDPLRDPVTGDPLVERGLSGGRRFDRATLRRLVGMLGNYRGLVVAQVTLTLFTALFHLIPPMTYKYIADRVIEMGKHDELGWWIALMVGSHVAGFACSWGASAVNAWLSLRAVGDIRSQLHQKLQRLRMGYHTEHESGELVGRTTGDTNSLQHFLVDGLPWLLVNAVTFVALAIVLFSMAPILTLWVLVPVPLIVLGSRFFHKRLVPLAHRWGNRTARLHSHLGESIRGVKTVKSTRQEERRHGEFLTVNEDLVNTGFRLEKSWVAFAQGTALLMAMGTVMVWWMGTGQVLARADDPTTGITLGTLLAFVGYIAQFYGPLQWFAAITNWMGRAIAGAERVFQVIDMDDESDEDSAKPPVADAKGDLRFVDVHFSYQRGKEVLKGLDFAVKGGEMVGLVGRSGAGKSTIINLVCRFFETDSGHLTIGDQRLDEISLESWRRSIGIVMQEPFLFNGTIMDNIRYGRPEADFSEVVRAAKAAHAHAFICDKEDGYDSMVGEGGIKLSGGQKQRIAIARAILTDPPVLILDEATSSVDSETEQAIQAAIDELVKGRTTIAIAHRLATLRNADRLLVIDDGRIVESGSHDELMALEDGHFAKLVTLQNEINTLRSKQQAYDG